jgi:dTDP-4-dehydrorhamnose 3,5-epimerase
VIFTETKLKGAFIIDLQRREDVRGFFARAFCQNEFESHGLKRVIAQGNIGPQPAQGDGARHALPGPTCRGDQAGALPTRRGAGHHRRLASGVADLPQHIEVELNEDNQRAIYVAERFAHGYQALRDNSDTSYQVGEFYSPANERALIFRLGEAVLRPRVGQLGQVSEIVGTFEKLRPFRVSDCSHPCVSVALSIAAASRDGVAATPTPAPGHGPTP